ncbi:MAG TPA: OB-fold nucleic acid binding domain-containing protein, partial [Thermoanaerobaculia bacterium]
KEKGQNSLFGMFTAAAPKSNAPAQTIKGAEWDEDEKLRFEKETLGFYITGHPLNKYSEELNLFAPGVNTDTLWKYVDQQVNIGGIVSQMKKSKIKKGPNEGKLMAKFFLDDQYGSVEVVCFSDLYSKYIKWLDNGVAVLVTASVKDTGGQQAGRSASLQSAEQSAMHIDDEYGGHPETVSRASAYEVRMSYYEVTIDEAEDDRDPKEIEREKYGADVDQLIVGGGLFGGAPPPAAAPAPRPVAVKDEDAFNALAADIEPEAASPSFAAHAAAFHESPITPELSALEIVPLDGIRDKKVKEIALEVPYPRMSEDTVKKIREIVEEHAGEIPLSVTITELPQQLAENAGRGELKMRVNAHFRVQPGPDLVAALQQVHASPRYLF